MQPDDRTRLQHMLDAALEACQFLEGQTLDHIEIDRMRLLAVIRCIEVIGEAAGEVSREYRDLSPDIPWRNIISMRNRLIHDYFDIDSRIVWQTVTKKLPILIFQLRALLAR